MPFTPSHALVALPFVRTPLVPAAIAVGAMTPDLPLFVRGMGLSYGFTHSPANIAGTTLIAAVLLLAWWAVLRPASVELAPAAIASRMPGEWRTAGMRAVAAAVAPRARVGVVAGVLLVVVSLMLGVLSHIVWDLFTHEGRWGVTAMPLLERMWGPLPGYKWLQHGSSVLGLLGLGVFALVWLSRRPVTAIARRVPSWLRVAWLLSLPAALIAGWLLGLAVFGPLTSEFTVQHLAYRVLPPACAAWGVLTLVLCVAITATRRAD